MLIRPDVIWKKYHVHCITSISPWYTPIHGINFGIANPRWRGKRSRHPRRMHNMQLHVKRPCTHFLWCTVYITFSNACWFSSYKIYIAFKRTLFAESVVHLWIKTAKYEFTKTTLKVTSRITLTSQHPTRYNRIASWNSITISIMILCFCVLIEDIGYAFIF